MQIQSKENTRGARIDMSGSGLHVGLLCCAHIRNVNENILDRVYSALMLIAHMSAEMNVNFQLVLSAAPLLRECW